MMRRFLFLSALALAIPVTAHAQAPSDAKRQAVATWHAQKVYVGANTKHDETTGQSGPERGAHE